MTLRNFIIKSNTTYGIWIKSGYTGTVIEDGEISHAVSTGIFANSPITVSRVHIHDIGQDGFKVYNNTQPSIIQDSYIERIGRLDLAPDAHADGQQGFGGGGPVIWRRNNWDMPKGVSGIDPNRILMLHDIADGGGSDYSGWVVEDSWFNGGNVSVTCVSGVTYQDNLFGRDYTYALYFGSGGCTWTNNRWEDTNELITDNAPK